MDRKPASSRYPLRGDYGYSFCLLFRYLSFILLSEDGEVYVAFRMRLEVDKQAVGIAHRLVHVVIERGIVEEQTQ